MPFEGISILGAVLDGLHLFRYDDLQGDLSIGSNVLLLTSSELDVVLLKSALDVPGSILQNRPKGSPANKYATVSGEVRGLLYYTGLYRYSFPTVAWEVLQSSRVYVRSKHSFL